jgi:hypothetical protein
VLRRLLDADLLEHASILAPGRLIHKATERLVGKGK